MQETQETQVGKIPGWGRSPGGGQGNPFRYSCLENPMDRGAWRGTVHRVTKSRTQLKWLSRHAQQENNLGEQELRKPLPPGNQSSLTSIQKSSCSLWKSFWKLLMVDRSYCFMDGMLSGRSENFLFSRRYRHDLGSKRGRQDLLESENGVGGGVCL